MHLPFKFSSHNWITLTIKTEVNRHVSDITAYFVFRLSQDRNFTELTFSLLLNYKKNYSTSWRRTKGQGHSFAEKNLLGGPKSIES